MTKSSTPARITSTTASSPIAPETTMNGRSWDFARTIASASGRLKPGSRWSQSTASTAPAASAASRPAAESTRVVVAFG